MEQEEVVYLKVFDEKRGDVVFEGKVSTDVEPHELVKLTYFRERELDGIFSKGTNERVRSFKGLQNNVELVAGGGHYDDFSGVLYVGAEDGVLRKSRNVPSCECVLMSVWNLTQKECETAFKCEILEELEMYYCNLRQVPHDLGEMKKLKKFRLYGLMELKSMPEEMGELSNLEELRMGYVGIESLPKKLIELKKLKSLYLDGMSKLQLNAEDLVVFSKLTRLTIWSRRNVFTPPFTQSFFEMIKSTTDLRVLDLNWYGYNQKMGVAALGENGSIVDGGSDADMYVHFFNRNKKNHERALRSVVHLLAIRRWRSALKNFPKEIVKMIAMMLWNTKCDVKAWDKK